MNKAFLFRALADETRLKVVTLLLEHNYCVSELARVLNVSESAVSQHLKLLKEVDLLHGEKRGYYMHYDIDRDKLRELAREIDRLAGLERQACTGKKVIEPSCGCALSGDSCSPELKSFCHGDPNMEKKVKLPMSPAPGAKESS